MNYQYALSTSTNHNRASEVPTFFIDPPNLGNNDPLELVVDKEPKISEEELKNSANRVTALSGLFKNEPRSNPSNDLFDCFQKKGNEELIKTKKNRRLSIENSIPFSKDEERIVKKKNNVKNLKSPEAGNKGLNKKGNRKSLENSMQASWLKEKLFQTSKEEGKIKAPKSALPWMKACNLNSLGVLAHTAAPLLQTSAFHKLKLHDLISSTEKLENIKIFLEIDRFFIESKTIDDLALEGHEFKKSKKINNTDFTGGSFVNNYPGSTDFAANKIFCDCFHAEKHSHYSFSILADGCGLGMKPRMAAQRAVMAAAEFINQMLGQPLQFVQTAENMAWVLIQSIAVAHEAIVSAEQSSNNIGTTTLNICFVLMTPQRKKYLMVAGVGDCKAFLVTQNSGNQYQVIDISSSKRINPDPRDPGGRLGPYHRVAKNYVDPDLRNLSLTCIALPEGESIIFNMSDGVHDNFIPGFLGFQPCEVDTSLPSSAQWSDLSELMHLELENRFQIELLSKLINEIMKKEKMNLDGICEALTGHCHQLTSISRKFMEENPTQTDSEDKKLSPGKMDHCSVVAFRG